MELIEQDSVDSEDIPNILAFILPKNEELKDMSLFGIYYNKKVFNGWCKQPSPCCGAASVAGAWNTLLNYHRKDELALNYENVLDLYRETFLEYIHKDVTSFERKLGSSIEILMIELDKQLNLIGRYIGGKKEYAATNKIVLKIIKDLVVLHYRNKNNIPNRLRLCTIDDKQLAELSYCLDRFQELYEDNGIDFSNLVIQQSEEIVENGKSTLKTIEVDEKSDDEIIDVSLCIAKSHILYIYINIYYIYVYVHKYIFT